MHDRMFFTPVALSVGAGHKRMIASLFDMHDFLTEFPPSRRRLSYGAAVKACEAARAGEIPAEAARDALITFAVTAGILWPSDQPIVSVKPVARGYGGFAA
ncbi:DUF982 domain-containing protein [Mesorhizobium sp.]|jgi:hypothetical protein|uniref:DUF982 domain-containing protein n=2 Tax=unclassified Mesorhizobium TaxID=325217 RepID=UPI000FE32143|nr:DUF982 domain-containing protein [Mesorhizobium sp.]RWH71492.1 MAG: DUF982 domain-containing protein [Mesorhizobium sp.]RWL30345.1 MAG: DUF982 domain-containing protein [Mesorhizobium sp.]RWL32614.1 MAG: DUF982 domain-containing protein [Mesorhizobium sp.]RWL39328.1 MAG: DUF982 domain-containing protein [Mesorhizobium sp.]RWL55181.1 MAG: DUF982 domain-containing protein [Mesorhizobium sp.]